jgi:hypothetical protein
MDMVKAAEKSSKKKQVKISRPSQTARVSGVYKIVDSRGGATDKERIIVRGQPLPPAPKSKSATLRTKSGSYVITSPAKSDRTLTMWSRAFKKQ